MEIIKITFLISTLLILSTNTTHVHLSQILLADKNTEQRSYFAVDKNSLEKENVTHKSIFPNYTNFCFVIISSVSTASLKKGECYFYI